MRKPRLLCIGISASLSHAITVHFETTYQLFFADTFEKAHNYLLDYDTEVQVILLNVDSQNGLKILSHIKEIHLSSEVLAYAEEDTEEKVVHALKLGALCYIKQPHVMSDIDYWLKEGRHAKLSKKMNQFTTRHFLANFALQQQFTALHEQIIAMHHQGVPLELEALMQLPCSTFICTHYFSKKQYTAILSELLFQFTGHSKTATLLIIDPKNQIPETVSTQLEESYRVIMTPYKASALDLSRTEQGLDILVLVEEDLQIMSDFLRIYPQLQVIVIANSLSIETLNTAYQKGVSDVLIRPKPDCLLEIIPQVLQNQFLKKFLPLFSQKYVSETLDLKGKSQLLEELCCDKQNQGELFQMKDIYTFFPELEKSHIPAEVTLPDTVIQKGISQFVKKLIEAMPLYQI